MLEFNLFVVNESEESIRIENDKQKIKNMVLYIQKNLL